MLFREVWLVCECMIVSYIIISLSLYNYRNESFKLSVVVMITEAQLITKMLSMKYDIIAALIVFTSLSKRLAIIIIIIIL